MRKFILAFICVLFVLSLFYCFSGSSRSSDGYYDNERPSRPSLGKGYERRSNPDKPGL